ncbi:hypothetical protein FHN55_10080 [Streptomyces sp. NP160]|nr:hypothetical protein FHN55_10080 [Streptomyces sp. NP160]
MARAGRVRLARDGLGRLTPRSVTLSDVALRPARFHRVFNGTSWTVRTGVASADGVSFESVDWPGHYLSAPAGGGAVTMARDDRGAPARRLPVLRAAGRRQRPRQGRLHLHGQHGAPARAAPVTSRR